MKVKSLSRVQLFATPWTAAYQAPPSMGFSRQEYWSGMPSPSPIRFRLYRRNTTDVMLFLLSAFFFLVPFFLAVLGLHCCVWAFSSCSRRGLLFSCSASVHGLLIILPSLVVDHGL